MARTPSRRTPGGAGSSGRQDSGHRDVVPASPEAATRAGVSAENLHGVLTHVLSTDFAHDRGEVFLQVRADSLCQERRGVSGGDACSAGQHEPVPEREEGIRDSVSTAPCRRASIQGTTYLHQAQIDQTVEVGGDLPAAGEVGYALVDRPPASLSPRERGEDRHVPGGCLHGAFQESESRVAQRRSWLQERTPEGGIEGDPGVQPRKMGRDSSEGCVGA
jgi:hypothetical protein